MRKKVGFFLLVLLSFILILSGCSDPNSGTMDSATLICEEIKSPNASYVTSDDDIVNYFIKVYQNEDHTVMVQASSNSPLVQEQQYTVNCDKQITKEDVTIGWTTLMGNPEATEEDQLAVAKVAISTNGEIISERNINFAKNMIETIVDTVNKN